MDIDIVIYGIIGALAILVCWLLDIYSPTMGKESISMYSTEILQSEKPRLSSPPAVSAIKSEITRAIGMREMIIRQIIKECQDRV